MMRNREPDKKKAVHNCYNCGCQVSGVLGMDFEMIESRGVKRFYCEPCMKKLLRGG